MAPGGIRRALRRLVATVPALGASESAPSPDPAVAEWPEWPNRVSCGNVPFNPVSVFSGPTSAELGLRPSEAALRRVLAHGGLWIPRHHWRLAGEFHGYADFLHGRLDEELESGHELETLELRRQHGRWQMERYGELCEPNTLRRGNFAQPWFLAPNQPPLTPDTTRIRVDVGPGYCDGKSASEAEKPVFHELNGKLVMTIWLRRKHFKNVYVHGALAIHACEPPLREPPLIVELPEALGDRELFDGASYLPQPAQVLETEGTVIPARHS